MRIYRSADQLIGCTPLLELARLEKKLGLSARLLVKLESRNPTGSAKDRAALWMLNEAEKNGRLKPGGTVIEPTSGNTGIGLAAIAASRGYRCIIVMPDTMSAERQLLMGAYGAELVLTDGALGMTGAIAKARQLAADIPGSFIPDQFGNPDNALAHYCTTGPEIWADTDGAVDILVAGVGTGGTLTGVGRYLREQNPQIRVVAVEPDASAVLSGAPAGSHGIQGIGAGFIPEVLDTSVYDEVIRVTDKDAADTARLLGKTEGILAGFSGGAALWAGIQLAVRPENRGKTIVTVLPDSGERYLSTALYKA